MAGGFQNSSFCIGQPSLHKQCVSMSLEPPTLVQREGSRSLSGGSGDLLSDIPRLWPQKTPRSSIHAVRAPTVPLDKGVSRVRAQLRGDSEHAWPHSLPRPS